jgi:hypothetical protein
VRWIVRAPRPRCEGNHGDEDYQPGRPRRRRSRSGALELCGTVRLFSTAGGSTARTRLIKEAGPGASARHRDGQADVTPSGGLLVPRGSSVRVTPPPGRRTRGRVRGCWGLLRSWGVSQAFSGGPASAKDPSTRSSNAETQTGGGGGAFEQHPGPGRRTRARVPAFGLPRRRRRPGVPATRAPAHPPSSPGHRRRAPGEPQSRVFVRWAAFFTLVASVAAGPRPQ